MTLRELSVDPDISEYDHLAATYEGILQRLFPDLCWRILRYQSLVQEHKIEPHTRPPAWVLIETTRQHNPVCHSITIDLSFFNHVSTPEGLLSVIGNRLKREVA
jgi:hypothetical protein